MAALFFDIDDTLISGLTGEIPESAVEFHGDSTFVQLVQDSISRPQVFVQKPIKTGLSDGISIEVISGVKAGDFIRGNRIIKK